jgi:uncharacterized membrane protein
LLAGLLTAANISHFVQPAPYARIVPSLLPAHRAIVLLSEVIELACAAELVYPGSRRRAGYATAVLFVAVSPANVPMAVDGGLAGAGPVLSSAAVAWLRLPVQIPLVVWALDIARTGRSQPRS